MADTSVDSELAWDHAADVSHFEPLDAESEPLVGGRKVGRSRFYGLGSVHLTYEQAQDLLNVLDQTHVILEGYLRHVEETRPAEVSPPSRLPRRCILCLQVLNRLLLKFSHNITLVTIFLQTFNILILTLIDIWPKKDDKAVLAVSASLMSMFQVLSLTFVFYATVTLTHQVYKRSVNTMLLGRVFISAVLMFAGLYTATYRFQPSAWKFIQEDLSTDPVLVVVLYTKFLFFSVSTATLCGSANTLPTEWYVCLFASVQMLLSFVYFGTLLGQAVTPSLTDVLRNSQTTRHQGGELPRWRHDPSRSDQPQYGAINHTPERHSINSSPDSRSSPFDEDAS